jgi:hypothetical protein
VSALGRSLAALALALGCASPLLPPRLAVCGGPLPDVTAIPGGDFALREQARFTGDDVDVALELLAERRGDRLVLVAFDAFGARAFSVVQTGTEVEEDAPLGRALAVPPGNALRDWHAARLLQATAGDRVEVQRPGCDYAAILVRVRYRELAPHLPGGGPR